MSAEQSRGRLDSTSAARTPTALALRFQLQYDDIEAFVRSYAINLSPAGMFIATREPPAVGTVVRFEVVLADDRPVLRGEGQVVWTAGAESAPEGPPPAVAPADPATSAPLSGMGVRFGRLDAASRALVTRVLAHKAAHPDQFFTQVPDPYATPSARYRPTAVAAPETASAVAAAPEMARPTAAAPETAPAATAAISEPASDAAPVIEPTPVLAALDPEPAPAPAALPEPVLGAAPAPVAPSAEPLFDEPLPPLSELPSASQWSPPAVIAPAPQLEADEEAALQALLQPVASSPLPTANDAARLLEELLERRPG